MVYPKDKRGVLTYTRPVQLDPLAFQPPRHRYTTTTGATRDGIEFKIPQEILMQERCEMAKLRNVWGRKRVMPTTFSHKIWAAIEPYVDLFITALCLQLPHIFRDRHRRLFYSVMEPDTWPVMFDDFDARQRATVAWQTYVEGILAEWTSMNIITGLLISSAVSFLALPGLPPISTYSLMVTICFSLASLTHATYYILYYRRLLDDKYYSLMQLRAFCAMYSKVTAYLLCLPMINFLYAVAGFSIATIAFMWPDPESEAPTATSYTGPWLAKISVPIIFLFQLGFIPISYKWNRTAFFVTNQLLPAEEFRLAQVRDWEEKMVQDQLEQARREGEVARSIPVVNSTKEKNIFRSPPTPRAPPRLSTTNSRQSTSNFCVQWVSSFMADIPENGIPLGFENSKDPSTLFAARVRHEGDVHFGKAGMHLMGGASIPYLGVEVACSSYQVLTGPASSFAWFDVQENANFSIADIPTGWRPVGAGRTIGNEIYLVASLVYGGQHIGSVKDGDTNAEIPYQGRVKLVSTFRVLLVRGVAL